MLKNELPEFVRFVEAIEKTGNDPVALVALLDDQASSVPAACAAIRLSWEIAAFSDCGNDCLERYFHYHLEGIRRLSDTLASFFGRSKDSALALRLAAINSELLSLVTFMYENFNRYFNCAAAAPDAFRRQLTNSLKKDSCILKTALEHEAIPPDLRAPLLDYIHQMETFESGSTFTYGSLFYFQLFVLQLKRALSTGRGERTDAMLVSTLLALNFNHLGFFLYQVHALRESIAGNLCFLKTAHEQYKWLKVHPVRYDPAWPPINILLSAWLEEEIAGHLETAGFKNQAAYAPVEKLSLNLSVAHLACLTRLFFEENLFNTPALSTIFKFITVHYQSRRQTQISAGSISKEYYSTSQVTAAVVRDMLLRMVARLNRNFFPVWAAISAMSCFCLGTR